MEIKSILTAATVVTAFCLPASPDALGAYVYFHTRSTTTSYHDPAAGGNQVVFTTMGGYDRDWPIAASIETLLGRTFVRQGEIAPSGTFNRFGPSRISGSPPRIPPVGSGVPYDYNSNGVVDAADYVQWRNGGPQPLYNDPTFGVQAEDYNAWRANFGGSVNPADTLTVAFHGNYDEPAKTGIFTKRGGQLTTIATVGQFVPSIDSTIANLDGDVAIDGSTVAFSAGFANGTGGIFTGTGGVLTTIAQTGDTTSLGPLASIISAPAISSNTVTFAASIGDGTTKAIFADTAGELMPIFKTGDPAPVGVFEDVDGALSMGGSKVAFRATYDGGTRAGIFTGDGNELTTVVKIGDDVPGIGTISSLSIPSMSGNEVAFYATWTGGEGFLSRKGALPIELIASKSALFPNADPFFGPHGISMGRFGFSGNRLAFRFHMAAVRDGNRIGIIDIHSPEPATLTLLGIALVAAGGFTCRRRHDRVLSSPAPGSHRRSELLRPGFAALSMSSVLLFGLAALPARAADLIHASAYLGNTGVPDNYGLNSSYLGSRFSVPSVTQVESVGGHFGGREGTLFAAIVSLSGPAALPSGSPFDDDTLLASTVFTAPDPSDDILVPLSVTLNPGHYGLIFGSDRLGAAGNGGNADQQCRFPRTSLLF
jgi:hypothetical protein